MTAMNTNDAELAPGAAKSIEMYRERLAEIEENWKFVRAAAKQNLLQAITNEGMSVATAARLSGHTRQTIKIWLDVWNAEHKNDQQSK